MKFLVPLLDWLAAIILAVALSPYLPGVILIYNIMGNLWVYSGVVLAAVAWAIARALFRRFSQYA